jgi:hypothetical protein
MSKNMVFELLVSFGIQMVKYWNLNISHVKYDYINTVQKKQVISREKYLPIFLNIFIVTGNQMLITSFGNKHLVSCRDKNVWNGTI